MTDIVYRSKKGTLVTTSLLVADTFNKRHADVLRAIDNMECSAEFFHSNFAFVENQLIGAVKERKCIMTRDGFSFLAMGFTGKKAAKFKEDYINAFNRLQNEQINQIPCTYSEALQLAADQAKQLEVQQLKIKEMAPKVLFADSVATSNKSILIGVMAKILRQNGIDIGQNRLFEWLRQSGYLCNSGNRYNHPTQMAMDLELFEIKETTINKPDGKIKTGFTTKVTGKGQVYFVNKFLSHNNQLKIT